MKNFRFTAALWVLMALFFTHCKQDSNKPLLFGSWQGVSWVVQGKESGRDVAAVQFEFRADDTYTANFGGQTENGTYRLVGDKLYTTGENKIEKMVELSKLSADTLIMNMNRVGTAELLTLVKK